MATKLSSADIRIIPPCIVFALRRESMYFRRTYPIYKRIPGAPCLAQLCHYPAENIDRVLSSVLMLETGVGMEAMTAALNWCLSRPRRGGLPYRPNYVLLAGFSGALQPGQRVGDLVLATEVVDTEGNSWPTFHPKAFATMEIAAGRILTTRELIGDPKQKQRLGKQHQALAVDMESAVAARLCSQHHVPFACLRVISDDWQTALSPQLTEVLHQGSASLPQLARKIVSHPRLIGEIWKLASQTRLAARKLAGPLSTLTVVG